MTDKFHRDKIRKACQLLLSVGDERAELTQAVKRAADQQPAGRVQSAGEALADGDKIRLQAVFAEQEERIVPCAGLDLVAEHGRVRFAAQAVGPGQIRLIQTCAAVIHHNQLVAEARRLIRRHVPALHRAAEAFGVVDRNRLDAQRVFAFFRKRRPQAAQHLGQNGRAVVAGGHAAVVIRHDEEYRNAAGIYGRGAVQRVKAAEHHLERRLHRQRAGLQIEHAVQNAGLPRL